MNRSPRGVRHAIPSEFTGATTRGEPDESLVLDARAGLTSADVMERTLQYRLRGGAVASSHFRMGPARPRHRGQVKLSAPAVSPSAAPPTHEEHLMQVVRQGDRAWVHFVKCFQDGSVVSSRGKAPAEVTVGLDHPRLPGLGLALVGLAVGERRTLVIPAREAYGPHDPALIYHLTRTRFAGANDLCAGTWVRVGGGRRQRLVRVLEVREHTVTVDANRRWAGQSLELEVEVIAIHGPGVTPREDQGADAPTLALERDLNDDHWRDDGGQN